jgi:hypothetical protein
MTFTDDFSRKTEVAFLKEKSEAFEKYKEYEALVENQSGLKIRALRSDNGGEYISGAFRKYLAGRGVESQYTAPYTPQQNGVAERKNRTLVEMARCQLQDAGLSHAWWAEAVYFANYVSNRLPTSALSDLTPEEAWSGAKPSLADLKIFGCRAYVLVPPHQRKKLDPKASAGMYLGPASNSPAHRVFDLQTRRVVTSRDVSFDESLLGLETPSVVTVSLQDKKKKKQHTAPAAVPSAPASPVLIKREPDEEASRERSVSPNLDELGDDDLFDEPVIFEPSQAQQDALHVRRSARLASTPSRAVPAVPAVPKSLPSLPPPAVPGAAPAKRGRGRPPKARPS